MPDQDDQRTDAEARRAAAAAARRRWLETVLLSIGATVMLGVTAAMAVNRLSDDTSQDSGRAAVTSTTSTPKVPVTPKPSLKPTPPRRPAVTAADERRALAAMAAESHPIYCGGTEKGMVALTFEGGPGQYTHYVLRRLERNDLRATFFLQSRNLERYGDLVAQALEHGAVGSNGRSGGALPPLAAAAQQDEVAGSQKAIADVAGQDVQLFRPPDGARDAKVDAVVARAGMVEVLWSVESGDAAGADAATIKQTVIDALRPGAIIRLHDNVSETIKALPAILHAIKRRHLRAVSLPLMLTVDPPSRTRLRAGRSGCAPKTTPGATG
jgi:peptidoglycan/xylan/chitin deacetylase (PgdA/CDA1 family)